MGDKNKYDVDEMRDRVCSEIIGKNLLLGRKLFLKTFTAHRRVQNERIFSLYTIQRFSEATSLKI